MLLLQLIGQSFLIAVLWTSVSSISDFDVIKFELQQLSDVPVMVTLKMFRGDNRDHKFNVTATVTGDDLTIYDVEITFYRSAMGNNQFVLSPFKIPRKSACEILNDEFRNRVMDDVAKYSNLPCEHDQKINYCDLLKKGHQYELINYAGNTSNFSPFVPTGTYKAVGSLIDRNTQTVSLGLLAIVKLY